MNFFTATIPLPLAEKLKEKGMPTECHYQDGRPIIYDEPKSSPTWSSCKAWYVPTYGEVFDWLMSEKGVYISCFRRFDNWRWAYATEWRFRIELEDISQEEVNGYIVNGGTWHEAAEKAIEKTLTLI